MAPLRSSVRRRNTKESNSSTINSLPKDLITEILAILGSCSSDDLFTAKKSSLKMFNEASNYNCVYEKVSLKKFPVVPWRSSQQWIWGFSQFMKRCSDSRNPEALFRQGMIDYFSLCRYSDGLDALQKAAEAGLGEARYIIVIILVLSGDKYREKGLELFCGMTKDKEIETKLEQYRQNVKSILRSIWIKNPIIQMEKQRCCASQPQHRWRSGWARNEDIILCDACRCDREVDFICKIFPRN